MHKDVLATVYAKKGRALVAPAIPGYQEAKTFQPSDPLPVPQGKGWLLLLTE